MRVASVNGRSSLIVEGGYIDLATASGGRFGPDPQSVFDDWAALRRWAAARNGSAGASAKTLPTAPGAVGAPVPSPRQVFAIGLNYRKHAEEAKLPIPTEPLVFTKFPTCLTGPQSSVALPPGSVDWEVELVVVIGERCEHVEASRAWERVAGLTVGQDISERRSQVLGPAPQFSLAKSFPGFGPIGPAVVTLDELPNPDDLEIGCALEGGEVLQRGRTSDLIFPVPELIARLSAVCPLLPGDLIFTGTPSGVGSGRTPQKFLAPGDVLVTWIEGIGELRNAMVAVADRSAVAAGNA